MAEKLMHLPTKPAMIQAEGKKPFVRRQHFQPNEEIPMEKTPKGEEGGADITKNRVPSKLINPIVGITGENVIQPVEGVPARGLMPEREKISGFDVKPSGDILGSAERAMTSTLPEALSDKHNLEKVGAATVNGVYTFLGEDGKSRYF
jgi:hypothetical protein